MARSRLCRICGDFHDLAKPWPEICWPHFGSVTVAAPSIRADGMDPIRSMADGRMYDSKSAYYRSVRAAGCEIVGNDTGGFGRPPGYQPGDIVGDIKRSIAELSR